MDTVPGRTSPASRANSKSRSWTRAGITYASGDMDEGTLTLIVTDEDGSGDDAWRRAPDATIRGRTRTALRGAFVVAFTSSAAGTLSIAFVDTSGESMVNPATNAPWTAVASTGRPRPGRGGRGAARAPRFRRWVSPTPSTFARRTPSGTSSSSNPATRTASRTPSRSRSRSRNPFAPVRRGRVGDGSRERGRRRRTRAARTAPISFPRRTRRRITFARRSSWTARRRARRTIFSLPPPGTRTRTRPRVLDARMRDVDVSRPLVGFFAVAVGRLTLEKRDDFAPRRRALGVVRARLDDSRRREPESRTHQSRTNRTHVQRHRRRGIRHLHREALAEQRGIRGKLARNRRRVARRWFASRWRRRATRPSPTTRASSKHQTRFARVGPAVLRLTSRDAPRKRRGVRGGARRAETIARARRLRLRRRRIRSLELVARLGDNNDGVYDLTFRHPVGTYALSATHRAARVGRSALAGATMTVTHAEAYCGTGVDDATARSSVGVAGVACALEIIARDQFGNAHHAGDETFTLTVTPPAGAAAVVAARVEPTTDGTYVVGFVPVAAGDHAARASRTRRRASPSYEDTSVTRSPRVRQNRRGCPSRARARTAASRGRRSRSRGEGCVRRTPPTPAPRFERRLV